MLLRREVLGKAAAGALAAATLSVARTSQATPRAAETGAGTLGSAGAARNAAAPGDGDGTEASVAATAPPPWELLSPLVVGATVAPGWQLVDLSPVRGGACVVTIGTERGRTRRIHLCRNDGDPQGIIHTRRLDLVMMNEGHGELPTEEALAQAVAAVAHTVAANEAQVSDRLLGELLAHKERMRRYAAAEGPSADGKLR